MELPNPGYALERRSTRIESWNEMDTSQITLCIFDRHDHLHHQYVRRHLYRQSTLSLNLYDHLQKTPNSQLLRSLKSTTRRTFTWTLTWGSWEKSAWISWEPESRSLWDTDGLNQATQCCTGEMPENVKQHYRSHFPKGKLRQVLLIRIQK